MKLSYVKALLERGTKTFAQTLGASLTAGATDLLSVGWKQALSVAGLAALLSVLTSVGSAGFGNDGPSLTGETLEDK
jgi:hypothetical protein